MHKYILSLKTISVLALISLISPTVSTAQDKPAELKLIKTGYSLSVASARLKTLREDLLEIRKKNIVLNEISNPEIFYVTMLIENIFLVETICNYESLLLNAFESMAERKKLEHYQLYYSRLKKDTLKRLYLNYKSVQSNFANITQKEILKRSEDVKAEMLNALNLIEEVIAILQKQIILEP